MLRRPLRLAGVLVVLGALTAVALGASGGFASSHRRAAPEAQGSTSHSATPTETLPQCLKLLATLQTAGKRFREMRQDAVAKRTYLLTWSEFEGNPILAPVSRSEFTYLLTEKLFLRELSPKELAQLVREARSQTAENLKALTKYIDDNAKRVQAQQKRCDALRKGGTPKPPPPPPAAGTFTLQPGLTEVKNFNPTQQKIDATGGTASLDTCAAGTGCQGARIKASYVFKVPAKLVAGSKAEVTVGLTVSIEPRQPLAYQISVIAPDFRKDLPVNFPDHPSDSATYEIPVAASLKTAEELTIVIGFDQASVTYHYRK